MTPQAIEASGATPGARVFVPDRGEGGYVSFTRKIIGKNRHLIRFDTGLEEEITWTPQCTVMDAIAALIKVDVSGNPEIGGEGKTALQTAIQARQPTIELVV